MIHQTPTDAQMNDAILAAVKKGAKNDAEAVRNYREAEQAVRAALPFLVSAQDDTDASQEAVQAERARQITKGCDAAHDDESGLGHLLFERFIESGRSDWPDFDTDFVRERRDEILDYLGHKWGAGHVALITEKLAHGWALIGHVPHRPGIAAGARVHHVAQTFTSAHAKGTATVVAVLRRGADEHADSWQHKYGLPNVEVLVKLDDPSGNNAYRWWQDYGVVETGASDVPHPTIAHPDGGGDSCSCGWRPTIGDHDYARHRRLEHSADQPDGRRLIACAVDESSNPEACFYDPDDAMYGPGFCQAHGEEHGAAPREGVLR